MKTIRCLFCGLLCGLLLLGITGCSAKKNTSSGPVKTVHEAMLDLKAALATASPEVRSNYSAVVYQVRYNKLDSALAGLQQMAGDTSLNAQQKDFVNAVIQAVQKDQAAAPPPAQ